MLIYVIYGRFAMYLLRPKRAWRLLIIKLFKDIFAISPILAKFVDQKLRAYFARRWQRILKI